MLQQHTSDLLIRPRSHKPKRNICSAPPNMLTWESEALPWAQTRGSYLINASLRACSVPTGCWKCPSETCPREGGCSSSTRRRRTCRSRCMGPRSGPGLPWRRWPHWCTARSDRPRGGLQDKEHLLQRSEAATPLSVDPFEDQNRWTIETFSSCIRLSWGQYCSSLAHLTVTSLKINKRALFSSPFCIIMQFSLNHD